MKLADLPAHAAAAGGIDYQSVEFDYDRPADHDRGPGAPARHPVVVVGAGPVGLALAIDLAQRGLPVVLLDNDCRLSTGSRAICFAQRTLEVFDRLGCGDRMAAKGVSWNTGRVFLRDEQVYQFELPGAEGFERPAFVNLQQYYVEGLLAERAAALPNLEVRWKHRLVGLSQDADRARLTVETPDGRYDLEAAYVAACDGSRSAARALLGLESKGRSFRDRFLIADVRIRDDADAPGADADADSVAGDPPGRAMPRVGAGTPAERWFWFDPPFHPGQSVLLHKQADEVWRIDFQLGWDADPESEKRPERILPRVRALLGRDADIELVWASVYTFACLRMDDFRHGRVLFAGDAAHGVSPFGARGANSGVQDADNLGWKLAAVLRGQAPDALLDSYAREREYAADENIRHSTRATDFITPKTPLSRLYRDAVLDLGRRHAFARRLVNSGRLSVATVHAGSALNTPDRAADAFAGPAAPGAAAPDAPVEADGPHDWLLRHLQGAGFHLLVFEDARTAARLDAVRRAVAAAGLPALQPVVASLPQAHADGGHAVAQADGGHAVPAADAHLLRDAQGLLARRYDARPGTAYLLRPDQHVCARWRDLSAPDVVAAMRRALALDPPAAPAAPADPTGAAVRPAALPS
jgi:3-(3-hydroxy-phenyl)propionate hydroxylase